MQTIMKCQKRDDSYPSLVLPHPLRRVLSKKLNWVQNVGLPWVDGQSAKEKDVSFSKIVSTLMYTWCMTVGGSFSHTEPGQHLLAVMRYMLSLHIARPHLQMYGPGLEPDPEENRKWVV